MPLDPNDIDKIKKALLADAVLERGDPDEIAAFGFTPSQRLGWFEDQTGQLEGRGSELTNTTMLADSDLDVALRKTDLDREPPRCEFESAFLRLSEGRKAELSRTMIGGMNLPLARTDDEDWICIEMKDVSGYYSSSR